MNVHRLFLLLVLFVGAICANSKTISRSSSVKPEWLKKGEDILNRKRSNETYYFKIVENTGSSLEALKNQRIVALSSFIGQSNHIQGTAKTEIMEDFSNPDNAGQECYSFSYTNNTETETFYAKLVDEYWEQIRGLDGRTFYEYYALFAVSTNSKMPEYDDFSLTSSYGAKGLLMSVVPGMGQIYKGSPVKGYCILGGEIACAGGIVFCDLQRASYVKKMKEQPKHAREYASRADNWENGRNICIGTAAALYVYNLVDAAVVKGARRVKVKKENGHGFSFYPSFNMNNTGVSLTYNF